MTERLHRAFLCLLLMSTAAAQNPKSITYLRLSPQVVAQRLQSPAPTEDWSDALVKQYAKAGIPPEQLSQKSVPGSSQKMIVCTVKGRGESILIVSASLERPQSQWKRDVAWAALAMLPLLAESLNSVSTESSIVLIAFPPDKHHQPLSSWYASKLSESERKKIKAAVEISGVGRGATTFDVKRDDRYLAEWLAVAATSVHLPVPAKSETFDTAGFADARAFRAAKVPAITVSSEPQHIAAAWNNPNLAIDSLDANAYYGSYQTLCVFLIDLDRAARGESPRSSVATSAASPTAARAPAFTEDQASTMIVRQIGVARDEYHSNTLWPAGIVELHDMVCDMARKGRLDAEPFEALLKKKKLSGRVAVMSGDYPSLTPEQLQGLKLTRFHSLSVATCVLPSLGTEPATYWVAALAF